MNAVTPLAPGLLEQAIDEYSIGQIAASWPAANGIENSNYFIRTQGDRVRDFVLTILEHQPNAGDSYTAMMQTLAARGLPVAPPIPNRQGAHIIAVDTKTAMLQPKLAGQHVYNSTTRQICALARFVARMHLAMEGSQVTLPPYPRDVQWLRNKSEALSGDVGHADASMLQTLVASVESMFQRDDVPALPSGMIHGDLFRDNVLFNEHGLAGVLDFHHASNGTWLYDLAVIANDWCNDAQGVLDSDRTLAMLRAYHAVRPLTRQEIWFFPMFATYAGLSFWISRLLGRREHATGEQTRTKNPDEFRRICAWHLRHPFSIDERLIFETI